jgi:phospholipase D1/2
MSHTPARPVLRPGRNCWALPEASAAGLLVDARNYYRAFHRAASRARRHVLLAGWRFNSDVRLLRGPDAREAGEDAQLLPFLRRLCEGRPELRVYVLAWDFSINYATEWELFQGWKFRLPSGDRLKFLFDDHHATGGSHHQKFAVVDGQVAFVGGLDFCADDWDDRRHLAECPDRADSGEEPHGPYHDVMACVAGDAAAELAAYFARRWKAAGGEELELPRVDGEAPAVELDVALPAGPVALSRTEPTTLDGAEAVGEVRQLYLDAIAAAERLIYVENQYFSSQAVFRALVERMEDAGRPRLDVVIGLPKRAYAWVEAAATGAPRARMLDELREVAGRTGHRLGVYFSVGAGATDDDKAAVLIHSKVMVVDDRLMTVGSANISNRSMGLDTELNATWEAAPGQRALSDAIRRARVDLLAEHCGLSGDAEAERHLARPEGLVTYLDELAGSPRARLRLLTREAFFENQQWLKALERWGFSFDPGRPAIEESLHEAMEGASPGGARTWFRRWFGGGG